MMTEGKAVSIKITDAHTQPVCDCCVGFLRFKRDGKHETAEPAGTGTFVKINNVYGILTAAHVLRTIGEKETVGLVRFPIVQPALQNFRLDMQRTDRLDKWWNGKDGDAPDIAFLKIPAVDGRNLEAQGAVFYNLALNREPKPTDPEHQISESHAIAGLVGEWTEKTPGSSGQGGKVDFGGLFGAVDALRNFKENDTDLVEVAIDHTEGPKVPRSYGGVSGGGLWKLRLELDKELKTVKVDKELQGVAFLQSADHKLITCNGAPSTDMVSKEIVATWPNG